MNKKEFLAALRAGLAGLPEADIQHWLDFYSEIIDDRMEEGMSEAEAVADVGPVHDIVAQIFSETPLPKLVHAKVKPKRPLKAWEIVLLVLGSPVWVPLLFAGVLVVLTCYATIWAIIISLYAVDLSLALAGVAFIFAACFQLDTQQILSQLFFVGAGLICGGLSVLLFFASGKITAWILRLSKQAVLAVKFHVVKKEATL